uniref:Uncharacterized protein n=4 Tax=Oryza TaxID=4527 RepID=A0A0D3F7D8_9ORYZ
MPLVFKIFEICLFVLAKQTHSVPRLVSVLWQFLRLREGCSENLVCTKFDLNVLVKREIKFGIT